MTINEHDATVVRNRSLLMHFLLGMVQPELAEIQLKCDGNA